MKLLKLEFVINSFYKNSAILNLISVRPFGRFLEVGEDVYTNENCTNCNAENKDEKEV